MSANPLINMTNIHKSFGAVKALKGVSLDVLPGETFGLLGDNAAGKSTLMKVLTGVHHPEVGEIFFDGELISFSDPAESREKGIEMIYQDFALSDNLDVRSNVFLGRESKKNLVFPFIKVLDNRYMEKETKRVLSILDIEIPPRLKVKSLSGGQRQAVAIARALAFDARLIIMDEPTANLSVGKVEKLIEVTKLLKEMGIAVIIITHQMKEAFAVADRVMVMRQGEVVGRYATSEISESEISKLISEGVVIN